MCNSSTLLLTEYIRYAPIDPVFEVDYNQRSASGIVSMQI